MFKNLITKLAEWKKRYDEKQYKKGYKLGDSWVRAKARNREIAGDPATKSSTHDLMEALDEIPLGGMFGAGFNQAIIDFNDSL